MKLIELLQVVNSFIEIRLINSNNKTICEFTNNDIVNMDVEQLIELENYYILNLNIINNALLLEVSNNKKI